MHHFQTRVYYENTDAAGIVYHADYLCFAERARTEMLRDAGFEHAKLKEQTGIAFAVRNLSISFDSAARLDDLLTIQTVITKMTAVRMYMEQKIYRDDILMTQLAVELVCINQNNHATRLPKDVIETFNTKHI